MRVLPLFRLMLALLALGSALTGPAAAAANRALAEPVSTMRAMPCHEATLAQAALRELAPSTPQDTLARHLCCVLGQLVVMPLAGPGLLPPEPQARALALPPGRALAGIAPATPVPPPRLL